MHKWLDSAWTSKELLNNQYIPDDNVSKNFICLAQTSYEMHKEKSLSTVSKKHYYNNFLIPDQKILIKTMLRNIFSCSGQINIVICAVEIWNNNSYTFSE